MLKEGFELLKKYNIPVPDYWVNNLPKNIEFPVVIKADIGHKTEKGAVILNINNYEELTLYYAQLKEKFPNSDIVIQKQITEKTIETIIGLKRDEVFDYVILFGIGGIYTEILKDFIILAPPFDKDDFLRMIQYLRLKHILLGYRGLPRANIDLIFSIIKKLEKLFVENKDIVEFEINPLLVNEKNAYAVDVRFIKTQNSL